MTPAEEALHPDTPLSRIRALAPEHPEEVLANPAQPLWPLEDPAMADVLVQAERDAVEKGIDREIGLLSEKDQRLFACGVAEESLAKYAPTPAEATRLAWECVAVARAYAEGRASAKARAAAWAAARDAAWAAAWAAAWDAAWAAAWDAAWDAARDAAWDAARRDQLALLLRRRGAP